MVHCTPAVCVRASLSKGRWLTISTLGLDPDRDCRPRPLSPGEDSRGGLEKCRIKASVITNVSADDVLDLHMGSIVLGVDAMEGNCIGETMSSS